MDITLNYTGNGYPISVMVYPTEGSYNANSTYYTTIQRYATRNFFANKCYSELAPYYTADNYDHDGASTSHVYKSSSTSPTSYSAAQGAQVQIYSGFDAAYAQNAVLSFKSSTVMSVYIASTGYGFMANISYSYVVIYSS